MAAHSVGDLGLLLFGLLCSEMQWLSLLLVPGSRLSFPLNLRGLGKNGADWPTCTEGGRG